MANILDLQNGQLPTGSVVPMIDGFSFADERPGASFSWATAEERVNAWLDARVAFGDANPSSGVFCLVDDPATWIFVPSSQLAYHRRLYAGSAVARQRQHGDKIDVPMLSLALGYSDHASTINEIIANWVDQSGSAHFFPPDWLDSVVDYWLRSAIVF